MKEYLKYKDSRNEGIKKIPEHWEIVRIATLGKFSKGNGIKKDEITSNGKPCIRYGEIYTQYNRIVELPVSFISEETSHKSEKILKRDILFTGSGETAEDIGKSVVYLGDEECFVGGDIIIFRLKNGVNPVFLSYLLNCHYVVSQKSIIGKGEIIVHIYSKDLKEIILFIPPYSEQNQIVSFLDQKTSIIDNLIHKKLQKIELLKELRSSIINQVITKGLNSNVRMKDSGVELIGKIPEHWSCVFIRHYFDKIGSGVTPRGGSEVYVESGITFIRSQNVQFNGLHLVDVVKITDETHQMMAGSQVKKGDLLLNITGASIGRCCVVDLDEEMNVNQHVCIIRTKESLLTVFLNYFLQSETGQDQLFFYITGANREGLTGENIKNFKVPLPPMLEQHQIIECLNNKTSEIDKQVDLENRKIDFLKEYRQSLISEVVTGKIDVREN